MMPDVVRYLSSGPQKQSIVRRLFRAQLPTSPTVLIGHGSALSAKPTLTTSWAPTSHVRIPYLPPHFRELLVHYLCFCLLPLRLYVTFVS